jgi:hypothetical protein
MVEVKVLLYAMHVCADACMVLCDHV